MAMSHEQVAANGRGEPTGWLPNGSPVRRGDSRILPQKRLVSVSRLKEPPAWFLKNRDQKKSQNTEKYRAKKEELDNILLSHNIGTFTDYCIERLARYDKSNGRLPRPVLHACEYCKHCNRISQNKYFCPLKNKGVNPKDGCSSFDKKDWLKGDYGYLGPGYYISHCLKLRDIELEGSFIEQLLTHMGLRDKSEVVTGWDKGTNYHKQIYEWLDDEGIVFNREQWFSYETPLSSGVKYCCLDGIEENPNRVVVYEVKSAGCSDSWEQTAGLYFWLARSYFKKDVHVITIAPELNCSCELCPAFHWCEEIELDERMTVHYGVVRQNERRDSI
jgi:hypothetical protein